MKYVVLDQTVTMIAPAFSDEVENGEYYELPAPLVAELEAAWEAFCAAELKLLNYTGDHYMPCEEEDIDIAPVVPILPPGVSR